MVYCEGIISTDLLVSIHTESEAMSAQIASLETVTWTQQNFFLVEESLTAFQKKKKKLWNVVEDKIGGRWSKHTNFQLQNRQ